jgi:hypothetical protein
MVNLNGCENDRLGMLRIRGSKKTDSTHSQTDVLDKKDEL